MPKPKSQSPHRDPNVRQRPTYVESTLREMALVKDILRTQEFLRREVVTISAQVAIVEAF